LALRDFAGDTLYWFDRKQNPAYFEHCERVFTRLRFKPARTIEPEDYHTLLSLVAEGRGITLIPRSLRAVKRSGIVYKDIAEGQQLGIGLALAWRVGERSELVAKFVELVKAQHGTRGTARCNSLTDSVTAKTGNIACTARPLDCLRGEETI